MAHPKQDGGALPPPPHTEPAPVEEGDGDAWPAEDTTIDGVPPMSGDDAVDGMDDEEDTLA